MQPSRNPRPNSTIHLTPPRRYRRLIEQVRTRDREWFITHPGTSEYVRPYVPGELWPFQDDRATHVCVTQIVPGFRTKLVLIADAGGDA